MGITKNVDSDYITELQKEFKNCNFTRIAKAYGMYITNNINISMKNDGKILRETQIKRSLRGYGAPFVSKAVKKKLAYFSKKEDKNLSNIYKCDIAQNIKFEDYAIQNIGHATQLIQIPGFNILTDPVFYDLNKFLYPSKTQSNPSIEELPIIDVIVISHNHRDHVDSQSLRKLLENHRENGFTEPQVLAPMGDKLLLQNFGFTQVEEVEWYTKIIVSKEMDGEKKFINFISIPADHRSGRLLTDHHKSLVTGWIINPENEKIIIKYSGDTRHLSNNDQKAVDAVLWYEIMKKINNRDKNNDDIEIPDIICLEPSGPNYTRIYMDITHQSTSYSALLKFIDGENLAYFSGLDTMRFLEKIKTLMIHHNKFELGPDRFNEGLFVFKKLLQYIDFSQEDLKIELQKQNRKLELNLDKVELKKKLPLTSRPILASLPEQTSLLVHAKDFIIKEITDILNTNMDKEIIKEFLVKNTIFSKIGERLNNNEMANRRIQVENILKYRGKSK